MNNSERIIVKGVCKSLVGTLNQLNLPYKYRSIGLIYEETNRETGFYKQYNHWEFLERVTELLEFATDQEELTFKRKNRKVA